MKDIICDPPLRKQISNLSRHALIFFIVILLVCNPLLLRNYAKKGKCSRHCYVNIMLVIET